MDNQPGPQNGVMGDEISLPSSQLPEELLNEEKLLARFSKTKEFKRLKDYLEGRIIFFQNNLPDGTPFAKVMNKSDYEELGQKTVVANIVIGEFKALLQVYENANEVVKQNK